MARIVWLAVLCGLVLNTAPVFADEIKPAKQANVVTTSGIIEILNTEEVIFPAGQNINDVPLYEILLNLSKQFGVSFVILEEPFAAANQQSVREAKPKLSATQIRGLSLHGFLTLLLKTMNATYLIRNGVIEIVPIAYAASITKSEVSQDEGGVRLQEPLVSIVVQQKPLNEVVAAIAKQYDLTAIVSPQAADAKTGFVTARILNQPADKALELLALQCDLRIVRKGNAYFITSKDHANELYSEGLEKQRQQIELDQLRKGPPKPPALPPPPAPVPKPPTEK